MAKIRAIWRFEAQSIVTSEVIGKYWQQQQQWLELQDNSSSNNNDESCKTNSSILQEAAVLSEFLERSCDDNWYPQQKSLVEDKAG